MSWNVVSYSKEDFEYWLQANDYDVDLLTEEEMGIAAKDVGKALGRMDILGEVMDEVMKEAVVAKFKKIWPEREMYAYLREATDTPMYGGIVVAYVSLELLRKVGSVRPKLKQHYLCKIRAKGVDPDEKFSARVDDFVYIETMDDPIPLE